MPNQSGNAYGLTTFFPIMKGSQDNQSYSAITRDRLPDLPLHGNSPMAKVPNTYFCRFYVLHNVFYEGKPARLEHLKSKYLVFTSNFYGKPEPYLRGMWDAASEEIMKIWEFCVGFSKVHDAESFVDYTKKCQVATTFFFNGSTDDSLDEQLKSLYLKQEFSKFVFQNQRKNSPDLQQAFKEFIARVQPNILVGPTWRPGASSLESAVINNEFTKSEES